MAVAPGNVAQFFPKCPPSGGPWYCNAFGESYGQSYQGSTEHGQDLNEPFHTNIFTPLGGVVTDASYHGWGGQVGILTQVPGLGKVVEYIQHLDVINPSLKPGSSIAAGQSVGLSGGQLSGGSHPNLAQYSSGPHIEFGFDAPWVAGSQPGMPQFPNTNPIGFLNQLRTGQVSGSGSSSSSGTQQCDPVTEAMCAALLTANGTMPDYCWQCGIATAQSGAQAGTNWNQVAQNLTQASNALVDPEFWKRVGIGVFAVIVVIIGLSAFIKGRS